MEKALAVFAARMMRGAEELATAKQQASPATPDALAVMAQMERLNGRLEEQMAGLTAENRSPREEIAALRPAPVFAEATAPGSPRPEDGGRKRGVPAATSRFFWDRVVRELCVEIRRKAP